MSNEIKVPPSVTTPGFEVVRNDENGFYYFRCNDLNGEVVLWSKDAQTQRGAESKLENALRFARNAKNYLRKKEGDLHFFTLLGGNKKEIAKSAFFKNEKELQKNIDYIKQVANSAQAIIPIALPTVLLPVNPPLKEEQDKDIQVPEKTSAPEVKPKAAERTKGSGQPTSKSKYSFKIDLYPRELENALSGKIEYLLTEDSAIFQGMDLEAIGAFMKKHLPMLSDVQIEKPPVAEQAELVMITSPGGKVIQAQDAGQTQLHFILRNVEKAFDKRDILNAKILVRSLDRGMNVTSLDSKLTRVEEREAVLSLPSTYFQSGLFRIQVVCTTSNSVGNSRTIESSCLFQIY